MKDTLMSIQIIPKTPNNDNVIPYVDEAIKIIDESGLHLSQLVRNNSTRKYE